MSDTLRCRSIDSYRRLYLEKFSFSTRTFFLFKTSYNFLDCSFRSYAKDASRIGLQNMCGLCFLADRRLDMSSGDLYFCKLLVFCAGKPFAGCIVDEDDYIKNWKSFPAMELFRTL